jgi:Tol biopolymer transport system component
VRSLLLVCVVGCGSSPAPVEIDGSVTCQRWGMAANAPVNGASTGAKEASPSVAGDHGLLAFTSTPGTVTEIYTLDHFGGSTAAVRADALDDGTDQLAPRWNAAGTRLYFSRGGALFSATYADGAFATPAAEPGLGGEHVIGVTLSLDETELFYGDNADPTLSKLHYAKRTAPGAAWSPTGELAGVNGAGGDSAPTLSHDQFTLYWASHRSGSAQLYQAVRQQVGATFAMVDAFTDLPLAQGDPDISSHDETFAYVSNANIYLAVRTCM